MNFPAYEKSQLSYQYEPILRQTKRNFNLYLKVANEALTKVVPYEPTVLEALNGQAKKTIKFRSVDGRQLKAMVILSAPLPLFVCLDLPQQIYLDSHITAILTAISDDGTVLSTELHQLDKLQACFVYYANDQKRIILEIAGNFEKVLVP